MLESLLDEIPQLGEVRRKALLERFGSVAALKKADLSEVAAVPGIGSKTAEIIISALNAEIIEEQEQGIRANMETGEIL